MINWRDANNCKEGKKTRGRRFWVRMPAEGHEITVKVPVYRCDHQNVEFVHLTCEMRTYNVLIVSCVYATDVSPNSILTAFLKLT